MGKIAVISDIHGNIDALNAVFDDIKTKKVDLIVCLGDLVSKYPYNKEVINFVKENCDIVIKGNVEHYILTAPDHFSAILKDLDEADISFLKSLPYQEKLLVSGINIHFFHATMNNVEAIFNPLVDIKHQNSRYTEKGLVYENISEVIGELLAKKDNIFICGHTHQEYALFIDDSGKYSLINEDSFNIDSKKSLLINAGSVGDPSYSVIEGGRAEFYIKEYIPYIIIEGDIDSNKKSELSVQMIKVPYTDILIKLYDKMLALKASKTFIMSDYLSNRMEKSIEKILH